MIPLRSFGRRARRLRAALVAVLLVALPAVPRAAIDPTTVGSLTPAWDFRIGSAVTGSPVFFAGRVYVGAWNGTVYALNARDGAVLWSFDTGSGAVPGVSGIQGSVLITPGPHAMACVGDANAHVWCLDPPTGAVIWDRSVNARVACDTDGTVQCAADSDCPAGGTCRPTDHVWAALATGGGRLFVSLASHLDQPCAPGRLVALDLASGAELWQRVTVPERICDTDTAVACGADSDCPAAGRCIDGLGAGVTATAAVDPGGTAVYMNTIGCFTYPSIGDSDSILKLDAATGAVVWKTRVDAPEQFGHCSADTTVGCGVASDCAGLGSCEPTVFYQDFGFVNGPTLVDIDDGLGGTRPVLVSASKNGTIYAFDESTGAIVWANEVAPRPVPPNFASFGLFNGPLGVGDGRVYAALDAFLQGPDPPPDRLQAYDVHTGATVWTRPFARSWSAASFVNGVLFAGNNGNGFAHARDAATGELLHVLTVPKPTVSRATAAANALYLGYGIFGSGGVAAFELALDRRQVVKCTRAINKGATKYLKTVHKAVDRCRKGSIAKDEPPFVPGFVGTCDLATLRPGGPIEEAAAKLAATIAKRCCGKDRTCGAGSGADADLPLDAINWDLPDGRCMGLPGGCDGLAVADGAGVAACLTCMVDTAVEQTVQAVTYEAFAPANFAAGNPTGAEPERSRLKCQKTIAKAAGSLLLGARKVLGTCNDKKLKGKFGAFAEFTPCPDADQRVPNKSVAKIEKAARKASAKICARCGGVGDADRDGQCDGIADVGGQPLALADVVDPGFACPDVTVPASASNDQTPEPCARHDPVDTVQGFVDCLDCVLRSSATCLGFASIGDGLVGQGRGLEYPAVCRP